MHRRVDVEPWLRRFFEARPGDVAAVYLFGSVARGTATSSSDVDVGVLLSHDPSPSLEGLLLDLEADLERELGTPVQVIVLNTAPCDLAHRVLRDGRLVVDHDPSRRIGFEMRVRNEFFDLEPILRRYRQQNPAPGASRR